ncbi:hypothetical protein F0562_009034 [Nyssa sinensis]|uniref:Anaphase-promoting complex subunit 4 WD40 domain-containing protein n=1 Tax=Nyssa sinensis TaxID=561372 RepID=A0A5J5ABA4_9ASTE|nr:hypothetical protein F0562_009034 [Nyssa sinensis]
MTSPLQEIILTSSSNGGPIIAYDTFTGASFARFAGSRSPRKGLAFAGKKLIAASHVSPETGTGSVHIYNWCCPAALHHLAVPEPVAPLAATLDGLYLFAGGLSGHIHALSLPSGDVVRSFDAHRKPVSCFEINDDGSLLFSGSDDGTIAVFPIYKLLDALSYNNSSHFLLHRFSRHDSSVTAIKTGMGGSNCTIISCSLDGTIKFWSLMYKTHLRTVAFPCMIWGVEMDPTESKFYAAGSDGLVYKGALKVAGRRLVKQEREMVSWAQKQDGAITALAMVNEGRNLITASEDGSIWIWEVKRGVVIKVFGAEMGSNISEMVAARGLGDGGNSKFSGWSSGFSGKELSRGPIMEVMEMERVLGVLAEDRSRAIDILGSAIESYEKLLELNLKEAKMGTNSDSRDEEGEIKCEEFF